MKTQAQSESGIPRESASREAAIMWIRAQLKPETWRLLNDWRLGIQMAAMTDAGNQCVVEVENELRKLAGSMRRLRGLAARLPVGGGFSGPLTFDDVRGLQEQLQIMDSAFNLAREKAAPGRKAVQSWSDVPPRRHLDKRQRKKIHKSPADGFFGENVVDEHGRVIAYPRPNWRVTPVRRAELLKARLLDASLKEGGPTMWARLAIALALDPVPTSAEQWAGAQRDWRKLLLR